MYTITVKVSVAYKWLSMMYKITVKVSVAYKRLFMMYKITMKASEAYKRLSVMYTITVKVSVAYKRLFMTYKITVKVSVAYKWLFMMYKITVKASVAYKQLPMLYKVNRDLVLSPSLKSRLKTLPPRQWRGHHQQLTLNLCRTLYGQYSFLPWTIRDWNAPPTEAVEANTLGTFVSWVSCSQ